MHVRALITFKKDNASNSQEARDYTENFLLNEGFNDNRFFSRGICDWFVIGGRYSGVLLQASEPGLESFFDWYYEQIKQMTEKEAALFFIAHFLKKFPDHKKYVYDLCPLLADSYKNTGYDFDAMIVTESIYDTFLKDKEGIESDDEYFWDLDFEGVDKSFIGKKWIVVVDYHT